MREITLSDNIFIKANWILRTELGDTPRGLENRDEVLRQIYANELQDIEDAAVIAKDDPTFSNVLVVMKSITTWIALMKKAEPNYTRLAVFREVASY